MNSKIAITRRGFVTLAASAVPSLLLAPRLLAESSARRNDDTILVLLRLGGGNDGLNTIPPCDDSAYHKARPSLGILAKNAIPFTQGLYFHPSLRGFRRLLDDSELAVAMNVGYPNPDRSHFRSMDIWHSGRLTESPTHGFLAPLIDRRIGVPKDSNASVSLEEPAIGVLDDKEPLALIGEARAAPILYSLDDLKGVDRSLCVEPRRSRSGGSDALGPLLAANAAALKLSDRLADVTSSAGSKDRGLPGSKLGRALSTLLDLIAAGVRPRVFYVAHDGFDTHVRQQDAHAALLSDLGNCLVAFQKALPNVIAKEKVLVCAFSEFGRRVDQNASLGTDHGAAAPVYLVSSSLEPGLLGTPPKLQDLVEGDVAFQFDFRRVYATLLERHLGLDSQAFLGDRFEPLPFLPRSL